MKFAVQQDSWTDEAFVIRKSEVGGQFLDAWISEEPQQQSNREEGIFAISETREGLTGKIAITLPQDGMADALRSETDRIYRALFAFMQAQPEMRLLRIWNYIPAINAATPGYDDLTEMYHHFNKGRFDAYEGHYGVDRDKWSLPAASAVGTRDNVFTVEFFAVPTSPVYLENKAQTPAKDYSPKFGPLPPLFARGAIFDNQGQRLLVSSGTAAIKGEESLYGNDPQAQFMSAVDNLRILISQFNLRRHGVEFGFGLEDLQLLRVYYRREEDKALLQDLARRTIDPDCCLVMVPADICREELLVEIEGTFLKKGEYQGARRKYEVIDGKIRVESLELHIVEHCNLRCHMCDAMSPYNPEKFLKLDELEKTVAFLAGHMRSDIFKLMGGEPLLHPQLPEIIDIVRKSGVTDTIRLTTNGLLLHKMPDAFWQGLDRLTVSNYSSSPMKDWQIELTHEKARQHNVILNLKFIDQFNGVMIKTPITDEPRVQRIYDNCWVRHRSLVVRNGIFFKCTRAAYMDDFRREFKVGQHDGDPVNFNTADGIAVTDEDFFENALSYLNSPDPLESCRYCFGASGKLIPHRQMSRKEVADRHIDEGVFYTE
jgi:uncharacterized radical SAM superfamily Fe-S cluster-containing enzyme